MVSRAKIEPTELLLPHRRSSLRNLLTWLTGFS